jgi:uncharacterized damage-inducible protein DinB
VDSYLNELYAHQAWADAEHWQAIEAHPAAIADRAIRERLLHIHLVQHGFLWVVGPRTSPFAFKKLEDFASTGEFKAYAQHYHAEMDQLLQSILAARLNEMIEVPWFQPPLKISVRHALTQAAMHSHYHRGKNTTRLRDLGGVPPGTDFIVWLRDGKPAAKWS